MTTALITIGICLIALGLMFRSLYLNDLRIKQEQKRQEMQEELDRQNLGETFDGDLEDWIIKATHKVNHTPIEQAPLFRNDDFGGQSGDIPMQKIPSYEDYIYAAASYECDPAEREEIPFSWPWSPDKWQPTAKQGVRGRIRELKQAQKYYQLAIIDIERKGIDTPLLKACKKKIRVLRWDMAKLSRSKEAGCAAKSPSQ